MWLFSVSEFVRPAMQACSELVRFPMCALFHPHMIQGIEGNWGAFLDRMIREASSIITFEQWIGVRK